jgi:hypothetical protein
VQCAADPAAELRQLADSWEADTAPGLLAVLAGEHCRAGDVRRGVDAAQRAQQQGARLGGDALAAVVRHACGAGLRQEALAVFWAHVHDWPYHVDGSRRLLTASASDLRSAVEFLAHCMLVRMFD